MYPVCTRCSVTALHRLQAEQYEAVLAQQLRHERAIDHWLLLLAEFQDLNWRCTYWEQALRHHPDSVQIWARLSDLYPAREVLDHRLERFRLDLSIRERL